MKVIAENLITAVAAASENASYPDDNVLDEHPKKVWKAATGVTQAMILCSKSASTSETTGIAVCNTNATSVSVSVRDPNEISWEDNDWSEVTWQFVTPSVDLDIEQTGDSYAIWGEFEAQGAAVDIAITLTSPDTVYAGVITAGDIIEFKNPQYGLQQGLVNYSILRELSNGETYHKQRDVVRTFSGQIIPQRDTSFYTFMHTLARSMSYEPMAWRLTDINSFEWVVYARFQEMPSGSHTLPTHSPITFSIIEVL